MFFAKFAVGAMVVFNKDGFDKSSYRKYNLTINENISGGNDFGMMQEVFSRRFKNYDNAKNNNTVSLYVSGMKPTEVHR